VTNHNELQCRTDNHSERFERALTSALKPWTPTPLDRPSASDS